jgi:putative nucleotidyltransferase with HDIG domain
MKSSRQDAWNLLTEFTQSASLIKHALAVEAAMRAYARKWGEDEELWSVVGLIHDFDYEKYPTMSGDVPKSEWHTFAGANVLRERGWPEELVQDMLSHASYGDTPLDTVRRRALFAVDELTGLIQATALVRPSKNILDVEVSSVRKKWKDKAFAAAINRADIEQGAAQLGVDLWEHVALVLEALKGIAAALELDGRLAAQKGT